MFSRDTIKKHLTDEAVIIVGYSDNGLRVFKELRRLGYKGEIQYCDRDTLKQNMELAREKVFSYEDALEAYKEAIWIVTIQNAEAKDKVISYLIQCGVQKSRIIFFDAFYYDYHKMG